MALNGQVGSLGRQVHSPLSRAPGSSLSPRVLRLFQPPGGVPGTQPLLPNSMDPTRQQGRQGRVGHGWWGHQEGLPPTTVCLHLLPLTAYPLCHAGHPNMGGSMQRMNPPRGMGPMGPGPQVTDRLSVCPSPGHLCAPAFSPLSKSVSLSTSRSLEG